jgi:surface protein
MFGALFNLEKLDLSNFDTRNVTDMNYMFVYCYNLTNLDLSSFDTRNVINVSCMSGDFLWN